MHTASSFSIKIIVILFVQQYLDCLQYINDNLTFTFCFLHVQCQRCVVLDFPCSASTFRYIRKTPYLYPSFVAREQGVEGGRGKQSGRKEREAMAAGGKQTID